MGKTYIQIGTYNDNSQDHHKELTINANGANVSDIVRAFMADDVEPVKEEPQPESKSPKDIWGIPQKGKYNQVREYIKDRKNGDPQFKEYCKQHSLREICAYLTDEFGWDVDEHSLGANLNRNR